MNDKIQDQVRVLRIVEYIGNRDEVERAVASAIHGSKEVGRLYTKGNLVIRAATIGTYPEILEVKPSESNDSSNTAKSPIRRSNDNYFGPGQ